MWEKFRVWARENARVISVISVMLSALGSAVTTAAALYHFRNTPTQSGPRNPESQQQKPSAPAKLDTPEILPSGRFDPDKKPGEIVELIPPPIPLPRPRDPWSNQYMVWVAQPSTGTGDGEGPVFIKELHSCDAPNAHFICKKERTFRMDPKNWPSDVTALKNRQRAS
jgi:hypothetical protein